MALLVVHPWAQFFAGMLIGCWAGAAIACAGLLLFVGRRVRQLESMNVILRRKLKVRASTRRSAMLGPTLMMPGPDSVLKMETPAQRIARVN
jgi:hypothetical protein